MAQNNDHPAGTDHELGVLLARAARPTTEATAEVRDQLAEMAAAIVSTSQVRSRRRVGLISVVVAPILVLGAAGAAYAATTIDWSQLWHNTPEWAEWAQDPDASVHYALPGGGTCELRLGEVVYSPDPNRPAGVAADPGAEQAARDFLRTADLLTVADVDATITTMRDRDENWAQSEDGTAVPFGYGTDNYNADVEYNMAVKQAIQVAVTDHVEAMGIPSTGLGYQSQEQCTGADQ